VNIGYFYRDALRRSRGAELPGSENSSIVRSTTSALCMTNCSAFLVVVICGRGIGCKLTEKVRRRRHNAKRQQGSANETGDNLQRDHWGRAGSVSEESGDNSFRDA
jgi:hypothetical protein